MKRTSGLWLFLTLLLSVSALQAQTRPRRVGQTSPPATTPSGTSNRPVLIGGTTSTSNGQPASRPSSGTNSGPEEVDENDVVRVNTTLVTIPVSVMDREGRLAPSLRKEDFRLWEDGVEQQIAFFATVDKPFSLVLMIDTSQSTRFQLDEIQDAAIAFVNQLQPADRVMIVTFDDNIRILTDFTNDRGQLRDAIHRTRPGQGTRLYDAVDMIINQKLVGVQGRKAIVLFTDGVDTTSRKATYDSTIRDAEELDALIFPVQYDTSDGNSNSSSWPGSNRKSGNILIDILGSIGQGKNRGGNSGGNGGGNGRGGHRRGGGRQDDYETANSYLHELADKTGARLYEADTTQNLASAFANVAEELRRQYSLGYYPKRSAQAGERRSIRVRVDQPNLAVRARDSYIVGSPGTSTAQTNPASQSAPVLRKKLAQASRPDGSF